MSKADKVWVTLTALALVVYVLVCWLHVMHV